MKQPFLIIISAIAVFMLGWFAIRAFTFSEAMKGDRFGDYQLKPKNVPSGAFWAGGVDGGNWYFVKEINTHRNNAAINVYNDQDGSLVKSKTFTLICPVEHQLFIENLKEQISGFDGEKIHFKSKDQEKSCYLQ